MPSPYKTDPNYAEGYEIAMRREQLPAGAGIATRAGFDEGVKARKILEGYGFTEKSPGQFTKTFTI
jgi:hypothetical protein